MTAVARHMAVEAALAGLFPPGVAVAAVAVGAGCPDPWPQEAPAVAGAVPRRVADFAAGRAAARRAMAALGHPPVPIPAGADRAPIWPRGLSGSIAHAGGVAVAVLREGGPLGVDIEPDAGLEPDLWPLICAGDELDALPREDRGRWVARVFSAKEAVYKAQYPLTGRLIGFEAVAVRLEGEGFAARFRQEVGPLPAGHEMQGRIARAGGMILTGVTA